MARPGLERLLRDARAKKIDVVLVWKMDRFGRSFRDVINNIQTLAECGVRFIVPQQNIDTDRNSPIGVFTVHILAAVAELERSFIVERTQQGYKAYREAYWAGEQPFRAFLGQRRRHSRSGKDLPVGRPPRIFRRDQARELRKGGMSWRKIAAKLGLPQSTIRAAVASVD